MEKSVSKSIAVCVSKKNRKVCLCLHWTVHAEYTGLSFTFSKYFTLSNGLYC